MAMMSILVLCFVAVTLISNECQAGGTVTAGNSPAGSIAQPRAPVPAPSSQPRAPAPSSQPKLPMYGITEGSLQPQECSGRCSARCSATQYKKPCLFFCNKCCATCLCVPPGTYGNKQFCPCYNDWKTKRGGPKCP